jgi:hypothetical protein
MEAICSYEKSVNTQRTTRRYIPEYDILLKLTLLTGLCQDFTLLCAWESRRCFSDYTHTAAAALCYLDILIPLMINSLCT